MKTNFKLLSVLCVGALIFTVSGCGGMAPASTVNNQNASPTTAAQVGSSFLTSLIGDVLGKSTLKKASLIGTWSFVSSDCKFESESFLQQAGGEIAARSIESKLNELFGKVGIKQGAFSFTFDSEGAYQMTIGSRSISGTYTFDEETGSLTMVGMLGITKSEAVVTLNNANSISLLYDVTKLMEIMNSVASMSGNSTIQSLSSLLGSYSGLKIGFELTK